MGFNARLHPYTVSKQIDLHVTSKDAGADHHLPVFRFPFAGELVGAAANIMYQTTAAAGAHYVELEATTNTGVDSISLWKHATDDTTATYATGLRALQRTGTQDTSTGGGLNWRAATTSGAVGLIPFSDNNTASAARRQFNAGDNVLLMVSPYGATDAHRNFRIDLQLDYIIGHEAGSAPSAGTGPA